MRLLKWIILFVMVCVFVPEACQAAKPADSHETTNSSTEIIGNPTDNVFNSLLSLLRVNLADLTEDLSHTTLDKKAFIRLFIYLKYSHIHFAEYAKEIRIPQASLFTGPGQISYYIYALHKIII